MKHLPALDGLRAIAVLAVVAYHADLLPAGYVGVDVFFVISGYLITRLLVEEGQIDFVAFYARRARRILPALAVVILATLGLSVLLLPDAGDVAKSAAAAGAFVANLFFAAQTSDYWAPSSETMPLLHLWSLSVEEQFYLVWPLVLLLARRKPVAALAILAVASLAFAEWSLARGSTMAFYGMPARAWELSVGGLLALTSLRLRSTTWGVGLVLLACVVPFSHFPGLGALPAVIGAALVIAGTDRVRALEARPVVYVGLISYSLYLWHWPLLALYRATHVGESPLSVRLGLCTLGLGLAHLSYRFVETPARRVPGRKRVVATGLAGVMALSGGAWAIVPAKVPEPVYVPHCILGQMQVPACLTVRHAAVIWGDSYAHSWSPFLLALAGRDPAIAFATDYCPPFAGITVERRDPEETRECRGRNDRAVAALQAHGADTVLIAFRWTDYTEQELREGVGNAVRAIRPHVRRILVMGPTPEVLDRGDKCVSLGETCAIPRGTYAAQAAKAWRVLRELRELDVEVVDAGAWLCDASECPGVRNGAALYVDNRHVTPDTARAFARAYLAR